MARINIDDNFFTDRRFDKVASLLKVSRAEVESQILRLWHFCYCSANDTFEGGSIDLQTTFDNFSQILLKCQLADEVDGKIRIKGVRKRIEYILKARENGKKSAEVRKEKYGTAQPIIEGSSKVGSRHPEGSPNVAGTSSSSSLYNINNNQKQTKQVGRVLEPKEVDRFIENLRTSLEIEKKPVSRGLVVGYLRTFDTPKDAEDHIEGVFKSAVNKASEVDGQVKYIQAAMANHVKQELTYGN